MLVDELSGPPSTEDSDEESAVIRKEKKVVRGTLYQKTTTKSQEKASGDYLRLLRLGQET